MQQLFYSVGERLAPVLRTSRFQEAGVLTPEEFVAAGDFLVTKCPTWQWRGCSSNDPSLKSYLPTDKQYLMTCNVPCRYRAQQFAQTAQGDLLDVQDNDWQEPQISRLPEETEILDLETIQTQQKVEPEIVNHEQIPDMETFDMTDNVIVLDAADDLATASVDNSPVLLVRTYDLTITYDKFYQVPRLWLSGYDPRGHPLPPRAIYQDLSPDYIDKTVTLEQHPFMQQSIQASIHPCRHASVMKRLVDLMAESGKIVRVDQYLLVFLKFMSGVMPTINYDFTDHV